jgi:basic amino acid/polyamine antiporter, APA family
VKKGKSVGLSRELNLWQVTIAGVGIILGAGIYALIGLAAGTAGNATWLAFLISAIIAIFTGFGYAELSSMYKGDAAEYDYVKDAFNSKIAFVVGLMIIAAGFVSASAVSLGFAGYFIQIVGMPMIWAAVGLVVLMTAINFAGIKESSWFNTISTFIEFGGLAWVIVLGFKSWGKVNLMEMPHGFPGVMSAAALVFFAYMGFESIVKLREETKDPDKNIPKALIYSIFITAIVYVLVAVSAVNILDWNTLSTSEAPLASVVAQSIGPMAFIIIGIIALFSTANTVLITLVTTSRLMYGMAKQKTFPRVLALVHKRTRTPWVSILILSVVTMGFIMIGDIAFVANLTNLFLFSVFGMANLSMIILRYKIKNDKRRKFFCPVNIGRFPVLPLIGFLCSAFMFFFVIWNIINVI